MHQVDYGKKILGVIENLEEIIWKEVRIDLLNKRHPLAEELLDIQQQLANVVANSSKSDYNYQSNLGALERKSLQGVFKR